MMIDISLDGFEQDLKTFERFAAVTEAAVVDAIEYILRKMCNYAKQNAPFQDHTSNLRNSISINAKTMQNWAKDTPKETLEALKSQNEEPVLVFDGEGYEGILSAGMEYAIWVELRDGLWVLQGAIDKFEPLIEQYLGQYLAIDNIDLIHAADVQYSKYLAGKGLSEFEIRDKIEDKHNYYNSLG